MNVSIEISRNNCFSCARTTKCRRRSCVIDRLLSVRRRFTVEKVLSAFAVSIASVRTNLYRVKRLACDGGCNICAAEVVVKVRDLSFELRRVNNAVAIGISRESISSSITQPAFLAAVTSGASVAGVNSAVAREAAAKYTDRCSAPNLTSNSVRMALINKSFNSGRFKGSASCSLSDCVWKSLSELATAVTVLVGLLGLSNC